MDKVIHQKIIILFLAVLLVTNFSWLAYQEKQQHRLQNQWFLYFQNPADQSLDFVIENYTTDNNFEWVIRQNEKIIQKSATKINNQEKKDIAVNLNPEKFSGKIIILVKHQGKSQNIYKIFH